MVIDYNYKRNKLLSSKTTQRNSNDETKNNNNIVQSFRTVAMDKTPQSYKTGFMRLFKMAVQSEGCSKTF